MVAHSPHLWQSARTWVLVGLVRMVMWSMVSSCGVGVGGASVHVSLLVPGRRGLAVTRLRFPWLLAATRCPVIEKARHCCGRAWKMGASSTGHGDSVSHLGLRHVVAPPGNDRLLTVRGSERVALDRGRAVFGNYLVNPRQHLGVRVEPFTPVRQVRMEERVSGALDSSCAWFDREPPSGGRVVFESCVWPHRVPNLDQVSDLEVVDAPLARFGCHWLVRLTALLHQLAYRLGTFRDVRSEVVGGEVCTDGDDDVVVAEREWFVAVLPVVLGDQQ